MNRDTDVAAPACGSGASLRPAPGYDACMWQKCSVCKKPIPFGGAYLKCGVSSCNRKRFQLYFCSDSCWDAHNPDQNHRNPSYTEHRAPVGPAPG